MAGFSLQKFTVQQMQHTPDEMKRWNKTHKETDIRRKESQRDRLWKSAVVLFPNDFTYIIHTFYRNTVFVFFWGGRGLCILSCITSNVNINVQPYFNLYDSVNNLI